MGIDAAKSLIPTQLEQFASVQQAIAPNLAGIYGREIASEVSFSGYSKALGKYGNEVGIWNNERLDQFLASPKSAVPGTYMRYDGLQNSQDREAILIYLKSL